MRRLFLLAFIWGWSFLFIKVAVGGMTPPTVAAIRLALGAAVVLAVVRARHWAMPRGWRWWRHSSSLACSAAHSPSCWRGLDRESSCSRAGRLTMVQPIQAAIAVVVAASPRRKTRCTALAGVSGLAVGGRIVYARGRREQRGQARSRASGAARRDRGRQVRPSPGSRNPTLGTSTARRTLSPSGTRRHAHQAGPAGMC